MADEKSRTPDGAVPFGSGADLDGLEGRSAVVTGATSGVGRAIARTLASVGVDVWAVGRNEEALREARQWSSESPGEIRGVQIDLTREEEVLHLADVVRETSDRLDYLVHSAGLFVSSVIRDFRLADFDRTFDLHVRARSLLTRELLAGLRSASGHVLFVNSTLGLRSSAGKGIYSASMHAIRAVADALRDEVNADGVRVTSLYLGRTSTPMQERIHRDEGRPYRPDSLIQPETVASVVLTTLALPRDAEITDIRLRPSQKPPPPTMSG